jgi:uncharacterized protein DUF2721
MDPQGLQTITSALAPVVMISAAGLLFMGMQTKNLHLGDRIRMLTTEYRALPSDPAHEPRRRQLGDQLGLFERRLRLSQHALESIYLAIVCFVVTSLLLLGAATSALFAPRVTLAIFVVGVALLLTSLAFEFAEMRLGLRTIASETSDVGRR